MESKGEKEPTESRTYGEAIEGGISQVRRLFSSSKTKKELKPNNDGQTDTPSMPPPAPSTNLNLSGTVDRLVKELGSKQEVYSYELVELLLQWHSEYAYSSKRPSLAKEFFSGGEKKLATKWIDDVWSLYNVDKVKKLHGRLLILGLALLDQNLRRELVKDRFIYDLKKDLENTYPLKDEVEEKNFESLLSSKGKQLWDTVFVKHHTARTLADDPATEKDVDILSRKAFAMGLVERMRQIKEDELLDEKNHMKKAPS